MSDISRLEQARDAVLACQGYGLAAVTFTVLGGGTADELRLSLRWGPRRPDLTLLMEDVHYFAMHRIPRDDVPFFDLEAAVLQADQPWPDGLPGAIGIADGLPTLFWIRGNGPATFDAVAAVVTVLSEPSL
jgi:hypothetical protein